MFVFESWSWPPLAVPVVLLFPAASSLRCVVSGATVSMMSTALTRLKVLLVLVVQLVLRFG